MDADTPPNRYASRVRELGAQRLKSLPSPIQVTPEDFAYLEQRIGATLPDDFKEFMRDFSLYLFYHNTRFAFDSSGGAGNFELVFSAKPNTRDYILGYYEDLIEDDYWLPWLLPFARDAGSNYMAIAFKGEECEAIYYCEAADDPIYHVAESFDQFFNSMYLVDKDV